MIITIIINACVNQMNPIKKLKAWHSNYRQLCPEKTLRQEIHDYLRKPDGRPNLPGISTILGIAAYNGAVAAALIWPSRALNVITDRKTLLAAGLAAAAGAVVWLSMSREHRQKCVQKLPRGGSIMGSYLISRTGGIVLPFSIAAGKLAHHLSAENNAAGAAASGALCAIFAATSAACIYASWKMEKLPMLYSFGKGVFYGTVATLGSQYLVNRFAATDKQDAVDHMPQIRAVAFPTADMQHLPNPDGH